MKEKYDEAAQRHWRDAEWLRGEKRTENADQLYGLAAECAVKAVLSKLPGCSSGGELASGYKKHIDELWDRIRLQSVTKLAPTLQLLVQAGNPFQDWRVGQRYAGDGCVSCSSVTSHRQATKRLLGACGLSGSRGT
ncbi:hypothetical protein [Accumulibacter sp.]|uniref:hypothetical protein n=1 Tax=Accumulibacter sp. TaxID=2053492 RepID=UPI0025FD0212|nr:hypothetical protein [Accumulibacter sp.]MCM8641417.1 hypothetical protein [Accumulibacter sp.]